MNDNLEIIEAQNRIIDTISLGVKDGIIITDLNRNITHINKSAEDLLGYTLVEVLNNKLDNYCEVYRA